MTTEKVRGTDGGGGSGGDGTDDELSILVCSANIGNAEPTPESFGEWVPDDGNILHTVNKTKYPITNELHERAADTIAKLKRMQQQQQTSSSSESKKKFDIVIIGMQEAAFVDKQQMSKKSSTKSLADGGGGERASSSSNDNNNNHPIIPLPGVAGVDDAVQVMNDGLHKVETEVNKIEKEGKKSTNKLFRKAVKANMIVRGLTTSQTYKSPALRNKSNKDESSNTDPSVRGVGSYDTRKFLELIGNQCPSYSVVTAKLRGEMRLVVLALKDLEEEITNVYIAGENTGIGGIMANKGGIIATFDIRGTRLSFMTCHLEAHEGTAHYINRNKNLAEIFGGAKTDPNYPFQDATIISHHMFVCGDLNYRIKLGDDVPKDKTNKGLNRIKSRATKMRGSITGASTKVDPNKLRGSSNNMSSGEENVDAAAAVDDKEKANPANGSHFAQAKALVDAENWEALNAGDELAMALMNKECLAGFATLPCNFPPTFKVARCEGYEYNEKRTPSYTDRILWKSTDGLADNVVPFLYEPCPEFITSDHKPIRGGYLLKTNKGKQQPSGTTQVTNTNSGRNNDREVHLLVSDIKCTNLPIMDPGVTGGSSDPYILFISSPKPMLWKKAWPSTKVIYKELNPIWKEDMHLTLDHESCRDNDGNVDLAGSMLFMTVMDEDFSSGDDVIGTVALNMNELCSNLDFAGKVQSEQTTVISGPILRNGLEFGRLECTISAAYLNAKETKAFLKRAKKVRSKTRGDSLTNKISAWLKPF